MDEFSLDRPELNGTLISMEFGPGGRIQQLWVSDPVNQGQGEEFQFVASPITFNEEFVEDYYPGTILLGARTNPDDPWILSRNTSAEILEDRDVAGVSFEYEFSLLPEIRATGKFYEVHGTLPQIAWDIHLVNRGRISIEIGELGFPMALNNMLDGYGDPRSEELLRDRVSIHKFVGGSASYLFAQRRTAEPPGLLIYPGDHTAWEFYNHVPASLLTPYDWDGIPVVYVYSRAAIEREGWNEWFNEHTSSILEPGDERNFQIRFVPASRNRNDFVSNTLALCGHPAIRLFPSAVAPAEVGIALEVNGCRPIRFQASDDSELDTESDEEGGYCFVKPNQPGPVAVSFEDTENRHSYCHLLFTESIETLIKKRAEWIVAHQLFRERGSNLSDAILPATITDGEPISDPELYVSSFGIESIIADALFLAEKNFLYPVKSEIAVLETFVKKFLLETLQNPGDGSIGCALADAKSVAFDYGCTRLYVMVTALYDAMDRISKTYGVPESPDGFYSELIDLTHKGAELFATDGQGVFSRDEQSLSTVYAQRSLAPSWWWYGSEPRPWEDIDGYRHPLMADRGEICFSPTTAVNSVPFFQLLDNDSSRVPDAWARMAFGGMLGIWALVRPDGAAAAGFCPDAASRNYGMVPITGDVGLGLYAYLKTVSAYVLPNRGLGASTFGCTLESEPGDGSDIYVVRPWDGVGRRVVVRQAGVEVSSTLGKLIAVRFDSRKRWMEVEVQNTADKERQAQISVKGMWGKLFQVGDQKTESSDGAVSLNEAMPAGGTIKVQVKVIG